MLELFMNAAKIPGKPWGKLNSIMIGNQLLRAAENEELPTGLSKSIKQLEATEDGVFVKVAALIKQCLAVCPDRRIDLSVLKSALERVRTEDMKDPYAPRAASCTVCQNRSFQNASWFKDRLHKGHQKMTSCYLAKKGDSRQSTQFCDAANSAGRHLSTASKIINEGARYKELKVAFSYLPTASRLNPYEGPKEGGSIKKWLREPNFFACEGLPVLDAFYAAVKQLERVSNSSSKDNHLGKSKVEQKDLVNFYRRCKTVFKANSNCSCKAHAGKWRDLCPSLSELQGEGAAPAHKRTAEDVAGAADTTSKSGKRAKSDQ